MEAAHEPRRAPTILAACAAVVVTTGAAYALWRSDASVMSEEGLIEWIAAGLLVLGAAVFGARMARVDHPIDRYARAGLALFCVSLALREIDIDKLGDRSVMKHVETGVRAVAVIAWCVFAVRVFPHAASFWCERWRGLRSAVASCVIGACAVYASSWFFDKLEVSFGGFTSVFLEETLEINAAALLLCAAFAPPIMPRTVGAVEEHA